MYLAAGCDGGIDIGELIFGDPIGEMMRMVAKIAMRGALSIFDAVGSIGSYDQESSDVIDRQTQWIVMYLAVGSILFAAVKMALDRKADSGETALKGVLRITLVNTLASSVLITFTALMDRYSAHLFTGALENLMDGIDCSDRVPAMLLLIIGCLLIVAGIIHALLMWIRLGVMIILMGTLPLAAAASMTEWGGTWWKKHMGWLIAWLLYKPVVSLVFFSGSVMVNSKATGVPGEGASEVNVQVAGMGVLLLSAVALPALMRVIVPAMESLGSDGADKMVSGIAGGIATGAKAIGGGAASLAGGAAGAAKPSGASSLGGGGGGKDSSPSGGGGGGESSGGKDKDSSPSGGGGGDGSSGNGGGGSSPSGSGGSGGGDESSGAKDSSPSGSGGSSSSGSSSGRSGPKPYSEAWYQNEYNKAIDDGMYKDLPRDR
ncbi:hypothetical protein [Streptomyces sp. NBC_01716]|uniref:hypothetical protein n=1 Tax=Streptomyces sp. NBC_01716 TaxID=2975917 RepID=UPI002E2F35E9|nr:hypothetical protein [Streptomyces sp. NBC_01716]